MGSVAQTILDLSLRQRVQLAGWENGLVQDVIKLLDQADVELEGRITRAIEGKRSPATIQRLKDLREELRAVNLQAYRAAGKHLTGELAELGARMGPATAGMLESALPFAYSFTRPSAQLLRSIITSQPFAGDLIGPHIDKLAGNRLQALVSTVDQGLVQGDSLSQILIRVRGRSIGGGRFRGGVLDAQRIGRPALESLVRTATQHVQTTAQQRLYEENADLVRGVMWVATLDHRTCLYFYAGPKQRVPGCLVRDGKVWDYDSETGAYKPVGHSIPWSGGPGRAHWQDRCTGIPVFRNLDAFSRAGVDVGKLTKGERAAMGGPVPVTESYETWIRKQPREIQDLALGKRRAGALRDGAELGEIWKTFQAPAVERMALAEALPAGPQPLTIEEIKSELSKIDEETTAENFAIIERKTGLREQWEQRKSEIAPEIEKVVDEAIERSIEAEKKMEATRKLGDVAGEKRWRREVDAAIKQATEAEKRRNPTALNDSALAAIEREIELLAAKQQKLIEGKAVRAREVFVRNKPSSFMDFDSEGVSDWKGGDALEWFAAATGRNLENRPLLFKGVYSRSHYADNTVYLRHGSEATSVVHELGHWLEDQFPDIHSKCLSFLRRRTINDASEPMGAGFESDEFTRPDKFLSRYMGKDYGGKATEILSMGMEWLYHSPWRLLEDEDMFDFILSLLGHQ